MNNNRKIILVKTLINKHKILPIEKRLRDYTSVNNIAYH